MQIKGSVKNDNVKKSIDRCLLVILSCIFYENAMGPCDFAQIVKYQLYYNKGIPKKVAAQPPGCSRVKVQLGKFRRAAEKTKLCFVFFAALRKYQLKVFSDNCLRFHNDSNKVKVCFVYELTKIDWY